MTSRDFCFWLQGKLEGRKISDLKPEELNLIQPHLNLVFEHEIDPSMGDEVHQEKLNSVHDGKLPESSFNKDEHKYGPCPEPGMVLGVYGWQKPKSNMRC